MNVSSGQEERVSEIRELGDGEASFPQTDVFDPVNLHLCICIRVFVFMYLYLCVCICFFVFLVFLYLRFNAVYLMQILATQLPIKASKRISLRLDD